LEKSFNPLIPFKRGKGSPPFEKEAGRILESHFKHVIIEE